MGCKFFCSVPVGSTWKMGIFCLVFGLLGGLRTRLMAIGLKEFMVRLVTGLVWRLASWVWGKTGRAPGVYEHDEPFRPEP
jgi:hypothetical protein